VKLVSWVTWSARHSIALAGTPQSQVQKRQACRSGLAPFGEQSTAISTSRTFLTLVRLNEAPIDCRPS
jgi:hypothetical protein